MSKLHEYNDIKDATQIVIGTLANLQQVTVRKLHEDFGLDSSEWTQIGTIRSNSRLSFYWGKALHYSLTLCLCIL